jgi:phosphatidylinositol kinase/protein kinase (PI-3  family)
MPHETASVVGGSVLPSVRDTYRSTRERELGRVLGPEGVDASQQALNEKALTVIRRVRDKLTGQDFSRRGAARLGSISCDVSIQVEMLIAEATSNERLCQCFVGWCPFW